MAQYRLPTMYIVDDINDVRSYIADESSRLSAAPTTGTWAVGDTVYNTAPAAAGFIGWVCTVAGSPGTWKTFGPISA